MKTPFIVLIVGPSGAGKTTLARTLEWRNGWSQIASYTTREPRFLGEIGHTFVTPEKFDELTGIVAYTEYNGHRYCATSAQVDDNEIYVVDVAGVETFMQRYNGNKKPIVVIPWCDEQDRQQRMKKRGDSIENISKRLQTDLEMFDEVSWKLGELVGEENVLLLDSLTPEDMAIATEEFLYAKGYEWQTPTHHQ